MAASWWDEVHWTMWRVADHSEALAVLKSARRVAREVIAPQLASARSGSGWTAEKHRILASLNANGLTSILSSASLGLATPLALATWELAWVDGGAATLILSGSLAQMPIHDFGTEQQRDRYLGSADRRHAALCLTEPIPGAGADATTLTGSYCVAEWLPGSEPLLEIRKRGRFTSHMDFADFVVAAVQASGDRVRGSCLVILEPEDPGEFDRGSHVRKLGHQVASTTNPIFGLRVPASRIVGGYTIDHGVVVPNFDHRQLLEPALRRTRSIMSLMTASKLLSTVEPLINPSCLAATEMELGQPVVDLWAAGEAAASLGFSAARISDELDKSAAPTDTRRMEAAVLASAAKLFSTSQIPLLQKCAAAAGPYWLMESGAGKLIDAQIESLYLGPEAIQRRLISAAMIDSKFLKNFEAWIEELEQHAQRLPGTGVRSLVAAMRLWCWTLDQLRQQTDSSGARLFCDARQGVTFPMADALCGLLAARSLTLDLLMLEKSDRNSAMPAIVSLFLDLSTVASVRAAGQVAQTCAALLLGYDKRFPVSAASRNALNELRMKLELSLCGIMSAREQVIQFLSGKSGS